MASSTISGWIKSNLKLFGASEVGAFTFKVFYLGCQNNIKYKEDPRQKRSTWKKITKARFNLKKFYS